MTDTGTIYRPATYQDLLDAPDCMVAELIGGVLHLSPRPRPRQTLATSRLSARIGSRFDLGDGGPGAWCILFMPELHLGDDVLVPDLAAWRGKRLPAPPGAAYITRPPDWVCETLSPGTRRLDLAEKLPVYAASGVGHLWLVDPGARTLEGFGLRDGAWHLLGACKDDEEVCQPPFEAAPFPLGRLWFV